MRCSRSRREPIGRNAHEEDPFSRARISRSKHSERVGADLSITTDHDDGAVSARRADRCGRAHDRRRHAHSAWPDHHHRECRRGYRQHRDRARAAPDGYTITVGIWNTHVANGITYALQYDVVSDFEPIALLADAPLLFLGKKDLPANSLKEL